MKPLLNGLSAAGLEPPVAALETYSTHAPKIFFGLDAPHLHLLTNHIPIFITLSGLIVLAVALSRKDHLVRQTAISLIIGGNAGALLTYWLGQQSYKAVRGIADEAGQAWLDTHMERAEQFVWLYWLSLLVTVSAFVWCFRPRRFTTLASWVAGAFGAVSLILAAWTADAGGKIRHPEIRGEQQPPSAEEVPHTH
jgi:membrane protein YqaA with SNARE-associated domain